MINDLVIYNIKLGFIHFPCYMLYTLLVKLGSQILSYKVCPESLRNFRNVD